MGVTSFVLYLLDPFKGNGYICKGDNSVKNVFAKLLPFVKLAKNPPIQDFTLVLILYEIY